MTASNINKEGTKKRMANLKPAKKGEASRNPKGRPKKEHTFSDTARELLSASDIKVTWIVNGKEKILTIKSDNNMHHGMVAVLIMESLKGNVQAVKELIDRTEGKATENRKVDSNVTISWKPLSTMDPIRANGDSTDPKQDSE